MKYTDIIERRWYLVDELGPLVTAQVVEPPTARDVRIRTANGETHCVRPAAVRYPAKPPTTDAHWTEAEVQDALKFVGALGHTIAGLRLDANGDPSCCSEVTRPEQAWADDYCVRVYQKTRAGWLRLPRIGGES